MKRLCILFGTLFIMSSVAARDFIETNTTIRILKLDSRTLADIRAIENKEEKIICIEPSISQEDFNTICSRARWITKLRIEPENQHITDLSGLRSLRALEYLDIRSLKITETNPLDLTVLERSTSLTELHVHNTAITNTEILQLLTGLQKISFNSTGNVSLDFLAFLPEITDISLDGLTHVSDFSPLAQLSKLRNLSIQSNSQATNENLIVLNESKSLQSINISNNTGITSLSFLSAIQSLRDITAQNCQYLTNTDGLKNLPNLRNLAFDNSPIQSIAFAQGKTRLRDLSISNTQVTDIRPLQNCGGLARLNISNTHITDISGLSECNSLRRIDASYTPITSTIGFTQLSGLRILDISNTPITVFEGFENSRQIEEIIFTGTTISDISPLYVLQRIAYLRMPNTIPQAQIEAVRVRFPNIRIDTME